MQKIKFLNKISEAKDASIILLGLLSFIRSKDVSLSDGVPKALDVLMNFDRLLRSFFKSNNETHNFPNAKDYIEYAIKKAPQVNVESSIDFCIHHISKLDALIFEIEDVRNIQHGNGKVFNFSPNDKGKITLIKNSLNDLRSLLMSEPKSEEDQEEAADKSSEEDAKVVENNDEEKTTEDPETKETKKPWFNFGKK